MEGNANDAVTFSALGLVDECFMVFCKVIQFRAQPDILALGERERFALTLFYEGDCQVFVLCH